MGFPLFKFTLSSPGFGTLEIKEPEGWDDGTFELDRNKEYHSLVEFYEQPLTFDDAEASDLLTGEVFVGGMEWIKNIESINGLKSEISILIEISEDDGVSYETCFDGLLAIDTLKEIDFYKIQIGLTRDDFWTKLINLKNTQVDVSSTLDVNGGTRVTPDSFVLPLPSQKIRQKYEGHSSNDRSVSYSSVPNNDYGQIDFENEVLNEIETKYSYPLIDNPSVPAELFAVKYSGQYVLQIRLATTTDPILGNGTNANVDAIVQINDQTPIILSKANEGVPGLGEKTIHTYTGSLDLIKGDFIHLYFKNVSGGAYSWILPANLFSDSYLIVTSNTVYEETETDAYLIKDLFESVLSKITCNDNVVVSTLLDGCKGQYATMKGLHLRGNTLTDKPFFQSLDDAWNGFNPIMNLGLGYVHGENKVEILEKGDFYSRTPSIYLDFVNAIERSYSLDNVFKKIDIGYEKWNGETYLGIDDPQSQRTYRTELTNLGKEERIMSKFIAASAAIEQTRRNRVEENKDWKFDDDTFIISVVPGSPEWTPEFDENFSAVTGLLNPDFRYNIRLSVAHNAERWKNYISGCLQVPTGQDIIFASGVGNFDMTTQFVSDDCEASDESPEPIIDEKGDITVTDDYLFQPIVYTFEHPITYQEYKQIRNNRKKCIAVSRTDSNHTAWMISNLKYKPTRGLGIFEVFFGGAIQ